MRKNTSENSASCLVISCSSSEQPCSSDKSTSAPAVYEIKKRIEADDLEWVRSNISLEVVATQGYLLLDMAIKNSTNDIALCLLDRGALISEETVLKAIPKGWLVFLERYIALYPENSYIRSKFLELVIISLLKTFGAKANHVIISYSNKLDPEHSQDVMIALAQYSSICLDVLRFYLEKGFKANKTTFSFVQTPEAMDLLLDFDTQTESQTFYTATDKGWDRQLQRLIDMKLPIPSNVLGLARQTGTRQILMNNHAPFNQRTLQQMLVFGDIETVQAYLDYGVPPNISIDCIAHAIWYNTNTQGRHEMINFLINIGVQISDLDISAAIPVLDLSLVQLLISKKSSLANTYLHYIEGYTSDEMIDYLISISKAFDETSLFRIPRLPAERALKYMAILIEKGAKPAPSLLFHCAFYNNLALMQFLISTGVSTHTIALNKTTEKPIVDFFLENPALPVKLDLSCITRTDISPLTIADYIYQHILIKQPLLKSFLSPAMILSLFDELEQLANIIAIYTSNARINDLVTLVTMILINKQHYTIPIKDLALYALPTTKIIWQLLFPTFVLPPTLEGCSPWGFNPEEFQRILMFTEEAAKKENDQNPIINAYKLTIVFGSLDNALRYLNKFSNKDRPVHDACLFNLPKSGLWNIEAWQNLIKKRHYSPKLMRLLATAPVIEKHLNGAFPPHRIIQKITQNNPIAQKQRLTVPEYYQWQIHQILKAHPIYSEQIARIEKQIKETLSRKDHDRNQQIKQLNQQIKQVLWDAIADELLPGDVRFYLKHKKNKEGLPKGNPSALLVDFFNFYTDYRQLDNKSSKDLAHVLVHHSYRNVPEQYKKFAFECAAAGFTPDHLDEALDILKKGKKPLSYIPNVTIPGHVLGYPGFVFTTMLTTDPTIFVLGEKTLCCQNLNGHSEECVRHGATQSYGGFVKLVREDAINPWVAQSWVGLTSDNELVFDSIENLRILSISQGRR